MNEIAVAAQNLPGHWYKGRLSDGQGNFCGVGHLSNAFGDMSQTYDSTAFIRYCKMHKLLGKVAREQFPERLDEDQTFPRFNDHPDTTEDEVVAVMEKAAIRWDEQV